MRALTCFAAAGAALSLAAAYVPNPNPEEFMDTNTGTYNLGGQENSYGNVMPDVLLPWGFATWSPSNDIGSTGGWFFDSHSTHLAAIRYTKQPSPWIGDYAFFHVMSQVVNPQHDGKTGQVANYAPSASQFSPYLFNATLTNYGTANGFATVEVTPTAHGAILRFTFPPPDTDAALTGSYNATRRVLISLPASSGNAVNMSGTGSASAPLSFAGVATDNLPQHGALHFVATLASQSGAALAPLSAGAGQDGGNLWAWADFDAASPAADVLVLRVATSLISPAQAQAAYDAQVAGVTFDSALAAAKAAWHGVATRVTIDDVGAGRTDAEAADFCAIFYSSLYRAAKFPRSLWEVDYANGNAPFHWSPYKGGVLPGVLSSDVGFWDAFRTTFSLLALVRPDHLAEELEGFLNTWRENGFVPQWPHPAGGG
jgi:putative alpha-1,2-mannosidase